MPAANCSVLIRKHIAGRRPCGVERGGDEKWSPGIRETCDGAVRPGVEWTTRHAVCTRYRVVVVVTRRRARHSSVAAVPATSRHRRPVLSARHARGALLPAAKMIDHGNRSDRDTPATAAAVTREVSSGLGDLTVIVRRRPRDVPIVPAARTIITRGRLLRRRETRALVARRVNSVARRSVTFVFDVSSYNNTGTPSSLWPAVRYPSKPDFEGRPWLFSVVKTDFQIMYNLQERYILIRRFIRFFFLCLHEY